MKNKKKLKIAICFFGHVRSYRLCAPFLHKNLLKYHNCDLFMHTWSTLDHNTKTWHNLKSIKGSTNKEDVINTYGSFKGIAIEEQQPKDLGKILIKSKHINKPHTEMSRFGLSSVLYSMRKSLEQCEEYSLKNNITYDYILFIRPDIWLKKPLKIENIINELSEKEISEGFFFLADPLYKTTRGFQDMRCFDLCFFATPKTISDIIKNNTMSLEELSPNKLIDHCPEYSLILLVQSRGFVPRLIEQYNAIEDWEIKRSTQLIRWYKRIIRLHIRKNYILIALLPKVMTKVLNIQINLLGIIKINLTIGDHGKFLT